MTTYAKTAGDVIGLRGLTTHGNVVTGTRHMVSAGHHAAAHAGFLILEAGGNAIDAGVAAGLALGVTCVDLVNVAGVAPIMIRLAATGEVVTIDGVGVWPAMASSAWFREHHDGRIPQGLMRAVVPAAPSSWITALAHYGTLSFGDVAQAAIRLARDGFAADPRFCETFVVNEANYRRFAGNAQVFLPDGRPPQPGQIFRQTDLARSLQYMVDEEKAAAGKGRAAGLAAAHRAFYQGEIAAAICDYHAANGGWLTRADMAAFQARLEPPSLMSHGHLELYTCGPWCQGPLLSMLLRMLEKDDVAALGHNSPAYVHLVTEAVKLACADREAYFGDPRFIDVPLAELLSPLFQSRRRKLIDPTRAFPALRSPATIDGHPRPRVAPVPHQREPALSPDTSYCAAIDSAGNVFSATPSDPSYDAELVPGTGLVPSGRGSQSWTVAGHPSEIMPFKRPRLTPNPAIAVLENGRALMPFGTPGGDVQTQAMLQVLLNLVAFGMDLRTAIEAPRFASYAFPSSFEPHEAYPNRLALEGRMAPATREGLLALGHDVLEWSDWTRLAGGVCAVIMDRKAGVMTAAADPRRAAYAVGW
ncbi:MAG TPA: gamma-glutamyltransferase [Hyphomicrobiaceae bacterium]|nr:gamma-glutamyltransferase [Hyphomicrobiaceae bacterium]